MTERYSRQTILPEVGIEGQEKLRAARVLLVGVGGLGSPAALYLAAAGVGTLGLIDPDHVDISNLQRQVLFDTSQAGESKVLAGARRLADLNPDVRVEAYPELLTDRNAAELFRSYDLVIDGSDNFQTKHLVCDAAHQARIPMVFGAISRFEGQLAVFFTPRSSCYRCLVPSEPKATIRNCAESGILGAVAGIIGSYQAALAAQWIVSAGDPTNPLCPPVGSLHQLDTRSLRSENYRIPRRADCPTCSLAPEVVRLRFEAPSCGMAAEITPDALGALPVGYAIIDVREEDEWAEGRIPGATHFALSRLQRGEVPSLNSDDALGPVIVYCQSGLRSRRAAALLAGRTGARKVFSLVGGLGSWPERAGS